MKLTIQDQVQKGARIFYNDGRPGHRNVVAVVIETDKVGMTVQFEDRADTTYIRYSDAVWMDFIDLVE